MAAAFSFALPSVIPQDLQLIQDLVGEIPEPSTSKIIETPVDSDHDHGTDSDTDSEKEVEADILGSIDDDEDGMRAQVNAPPSASTSDSDSSSDSDSDGDVPQARKAVPKQTEVDGDDDEDTGPSDAQVRTKNEMVEIDIMIPEIWEVGPHDELERVGEVMSIVDKVVIVKGQTSGITNRGSEKALDSDTLLVFEDRKVLGFIFETFGPTSEPLYQIRFNSKFPLDSEKVQVGRAVYHVPDRSNYVFVRQLRQFRGSDASNVHDEEPGDDEVEFSDDEQEAAHKRAAAQRREQSRGRSVVSSRHTTPVPSRMRDQDMADDPYGGGPYEQSLSYNDMDFGAGPSRPAPIPYDDPYSDSYGAPLQPNSQVSPVSPSSPTASSSPHGSRPERISQRGRGRGASQRREETSRGRGRGRRQNDRGRGRGRGRGGDFAGSSDGRSGRQAPPSAEHSPRLPSPTSLAIARATGQFAEGPPADPSGMYAQMQMQQPGGWGYPQAPMHGYDFSYAYQYPQVQPHINPRFASNFGMGGMGMGLDMNMGYQYGAQPAPYIHNATGYQGGGHSVDSGGWGGGSEWDPSSQAPHNSQSGGGGENAQ
ncbi:Gar1/Naf1 RNA binding region-domain-containing protein [Lenzites betulinus]|nr:Gar1/Naf1 RNA binding region-domain-containing protein [Lenzites betulinus]